MAERMGGERAEQSTDGRVQRSRRTQAAIARAVLELAQRGQLRPPVHEIAAHAGVSERAVFRHFEDTESLFNAVAKLQLERVTRELPALVDPSRSFDERLRSYVGRWTWVHERTTPVRRASLLNEPFSAEIQRRHAKVREARIEDFMHLFNAELARLEPAEESDLIEAISIAMSWAAWNHMRRYRRLSVRRATHVLMHMLEALLAGIR